MIYLARQRAFSTQDPSCCYANLQTLGFKRGDCLNDQKVWGYCSYKDKFGKFKVA